jgi:hypothetical protein
MIQHVRRRLAEATVACFRSRNATDGVLDYCASASRADISAASGTSEACISA